MAQEGKCSGRCLTCYCLHSFLKEAGVYFRSIWEWCSPWWGMYDGRSWRTQLVMSQLMSSLSLLKIHRDRFVLPVYPCTHWYGIMLEHSWPTRRCTLKAKVTILPRSHLLPIATHKSGLVSRFLLWCWSINWRHLWGSCAWVHSWF